jgi:hypothetical protein
MSVIPAGIKMTTLPPGIPFSQEAPDNSVKRNLVAVPVGRVPNLATEDSPEEWQCRLRSLQQWICELLIENQQLRWILMEMKELDPRGDEGRNIQGIRGND